MALSDCLLYANSHDGLVKMHIILNVYLDIERFTIPGKVSLKKIKNVNTAAN